MTTRDRLKALKSWLSGHDAGDITLLFGRRIRRVHVTQMVTLQEFNDVAKTFWAQRDDKAMAEVDGRNGKEVPVL